MLVLPRQKLASTYASANGGAKGCYALADATAGKTPHVVLFGGRPRCYRASVIPAGCRGSRSKPGTRGVARASGGAR